MVDVFISYSRDDRAACIRFAERLGALGLDVWFDARLESGKAFDLEIEERVTAARAVLVLWSRRSTKSGWVRSEATIGQRRDVLVSAQIEPCDLPVAFITTHTEQLFGAAISDSNPAWTNILTRLEKLTGHPGLVAYRGKALRPSGRIKRSKSSLTLLSGFVAVGGIGAAAAFALMQSQGETAEPAVDAPLGTTLAAPTGMADAITLPASAPPDEATLFAQTLIGQWAVFPSQCPPEGTPAAVELSPSAGSWLTVDAERGSLLTTSFSKTNREIVVGLSDGWLNTFVDDENMFYRLSAEGRLMVRVGQGEAQELVACK